MSAAIQPAGAEHLEDLVAFADSLQQGGAPLSAAIVRGLATELATESAVSRLLLAAPAAHRPLFGMRALASVHRLALTGQAPRLAAHLASLERAGSGALEGVIEHGVPANQTTLWKLVRDTMLARTREITEDLDGPVQQHEPARSGALLTGLAMLGAPQIRLLEIGACAGLNLILDRYCWLGPGWQWGDPDSALRLDACDPDPRSIEIVERAGCDLRPRNPTNASDAAALRSWIPPEDVESRRQLDMAIGIAARDPVIVEPQPAATWLPNRLARIDPRSDPDVHTVVWHSLVWCYLDTAEQQSIEATLTRAARDLPLTRIGFEPSHWAGPSQLRITRYP